MADNKSIITLSSPWCFNAMSLEQSEVRELQKHFVNEDNHQCDWSNTDYCGITSDGLSEYFSSPEFFDEDDDNNKTTVYTIKQLRDIIAEHLAKQPVEPESVTKFVVGKWYKWFQKDHGRTQKGKCATLYDSHFEMKPWICNSSEYVESGMFNLRDAESIEIIEDLSEIQDLLPEGHPDKWVKTEPNSERYLATMKFFEQLREPERSEAIANYDEEYSIYIPKSLESALSSGFCWDNTEQESDYWEHIHGMLLDNTYFQEELLVFGKYKVGVIVVSLKCVGKHRKIGEMFAVLSDSSKNRLYFEPMTCSTEPESWRLATPEEVEAYNQGIRNVADIKPKDYKEAVHCTTQEEWDFVLSKILSVCTTSSQFGENNCINIKDTVNPTNEGWCCTENYYKRNNYTILTFKQWCEKYGHSYEVIPEYVECVGSTSHHYKEGKIYTWPKTITEEGKPNKPGILNGCVWEFKPSTKEAYDKQQEKLKMEELLNEAKRRYPTGTKVRAVLDGPELTTEIFTLTDSHYWASGSKVPACYTEEGHPVCLHLSGKWAEIVKEEPKPTEIKPAKGMHVRCLKENSWSDGKTKIGQIFVIEDVHWSGDMWVNNHLFAKERLGRGEFELLPDYKEEPWVAQVGDWVYVLENCAYGSVLNKGEIVKCIKYDTISQQFKEEGCTWLTPKYYRKATQEEIDSVIKYSESRWPVTENVAWSEWTADNWYVEVSSQEEANAVIDAAAKMYGVKAKKSLEFDPAVWKFVCKHRNCNYVAVASSIWFNTEAKPRPITDFIQPEKPTLLETVKKTFFDKPTQQATPDDSYIFAGEVTEEEFNEIKRLCKPQQDELVIYKPKQTRLVEPGAVSASASTTNLIIKSNSKYL